MMQRKEIESKLTLYNELKGILGAMKSFALVELRKLTKREGAENIAMSLASEALQIMSPALPKFPDKYCDIWILFGSARGFCSSFNEDIVRIWQEQNGNACQTIIVGERLASLIPESEMITYIPGANGSHDATDVITNLVSKIEETGKRKGQKFGLIACLHNKQLANTHRLLPFITPANTSKELPLTNEPPETVATSVAEHYLFHSMFALLLQSLYVENHMRLMQMESAIKHIDDKLEAMQIMRNRLRQEEIVEEIELIAGSALI